MIRAVSTPRSDFFQQGGSGSFRRQVIACDQRRNMILARLKRCLADSITA